MNQQSATLFPVLPTAVDPGLRAAPSPETELLLCCARTHLEPQAAERARILVRDGIDWAGLVEIARHQRLIPLLYRERILLLALQLARSLLGVEPARGSLDALRADPVVHALAARVRPQLLRAPDAAGASRAWDSAFYLRARERYSDKLQYISLRTLGPARLLVTPTERDRRFLRLPPALTPLYYVVRPLRALRDRLRVRNDP